MLRRSFHVDLAADAESAMWLLEKGAYDVVVSDHSMPGRSGRELLEEIAARFPKARRILMSADADAATAEPHP
ncbi:MAG TPA: response regulator, partial [Labilithrix sp.]